MYIYIYIRHRACAQACKGGGFSHAFTIVLLRLVIFFDFNALGGPGFRSPPSAPHGLTPQNPPRRPLFFIIFWMPFWIDF